MRLLSPVVCAVALAACDDEPDMETKLREEPRYIPGGGNEDAIAPRSPAGGVHTYAPTFAAIHQETFIPTCAALFCHSSEEYFFNSVTADRAYETLVGAATNSPDCGPTGLLRVDPGRPERSLLYLKLTEPPCGRKMPLGFEWLPAPEIEQIRVWIERGAPRFETDE